MVPVLRVLASVFKKLLIAGFLVVLQAILSATIKDVTDAAGFSILKSVAKGYGFIRNGFGSMVNGAPVQNAVNQTLPDPTPAV